MEKAGHVLNPFATFAHNGRWYYVDKTGEVYRADLLRQVGSPRSRGSLSWDTLGVYTCTHNILYFRKYGRIYY
jgi:hypothetical protein